MDNQDFRGFAGRICSGVFKPEDKIKVLPSGVVSTIKTIELNGDQLREAYAPMSITMTLNDEIDISRGDMIVRENNIPDIGQDIDVLVTWMNEKSIHSRTKVIVKHTSNECIAIVKELKYKIDINNLHRIKPINDLKINEIGRISLRTSKPLFYDIYKNNRQTGSLIIIDDQTNETIGAGMIIK
jgi:sulfate adenylyltransferase subunit 1